MKRLKSPKDESLQENKPMAKTGISDKDRNKILGEIDKHQSNKQPFYKRLFKKRKDEFVLLFNTGTHNIKIDPKYKIKSVGLEELREFCHAAVCGGGENLFSYEINNDFIEIKAKIVTNFAVLRVSLNKSC